MNLAVKIYQDVPFELRPLDIPIVWPAEIIELGESSELPGAGYTLMTTEDLAAYKLFHLAAFNTWNNARIAAASAKQIENASIDFARKGCEEALRLMVKIKAKNKADGINAKQAMWMHHRLRDWHIVMTGTPMVVDIPKMFIFGDIEMAILSFQLGTPDDMTEPHHWLSAARVASIITELQSQLPS